MLDKSIKRYGTGAQRIRSASVPAALSVLWMILQSSQLSMTADPITCPMRPLHWLFSFELAVQTIFDKNAAVEKYFLYSRVVVCQYFSSAFRSSSGVVMGAIPKFSTR